MTENAPMSVTSAAMPSIEPALAGTSSLRVSRRIGRFLTIGVIIFALAAAAFAFWVTREHNRLAGTASEQMVRGGFSALDDTLKTVTMDFAIWPDAVEAMRADDRTWVWENIGISAAVTETTDLMMVQTADRSTAYGWSPGMDAEPSTELLAPEVIDLMNALLDEVEIADRRAVSAYAMSGDTRWLLSAARMVSDDPAEDPTSDAEIPRLIYGFELDTELVREIGAEYLIEDLSIAEQPVGDTTAIPLAGHAGDPIAYAVWTPPRPGDQILRGIAVPLTVGVGMLTLIAFVSAGLLSRSARRLESTMLAAQAASRAKTDFIANISHELRTPMNGIMGLTALLRQTALDDRQQEMVGMLSSSAETQMSLIGDLLDISSIENGHLSLNLAPFRPADIARSVSALFQIEATDKGLALITKLDDMPENSVIGDRERYRQVCANVISNAVKFTESGQVTVSMHQRERLGEALVTLEVQDTGPGIHAADREQIFERFAQGRSRQLGKAHGSGLGLSITQTIVELMGGTVSVDSVPGQGSTFVVDVPFELADTVEAENAA